MFFNDRTPVAKWFCGINSAPLFVGCVWQHYFTEHSEALFKTSPCKLPSPPPNPQQTFRKISLRFNADLGEGAEGGWGQALWLADLHPIEHGNDRCVLKRGGCDSHFSAGQLKAAYIHVADEGLIYE